MISTLEKNRLKKLSVYELTLKTQGFQCIAGVDEAGRGPLAGPVVSAACILPEKTLLHGLNDSKKLPHKLRLELFQKLLQLKDIQYGVGVASIEEIDQMNILQATFLSMKRAVENLSKKPDHLLIDGNRAPLFEIPLTTIIKGDSKSISIAAASILAKETRDKMMIEFDAVWPEYGFKSHKGYGTKEHLKALQKYGPSPLHRKSFDPIKSMISTLQRAFF